MKTNAQLLVIPLALSAVLWGCEDRVSGPEAPRAGPVFAQAGKSEDLAYTLTYHFLDRELEDAIVGDDRVKDPAGGTDYTNNECGVGAVYQSGNPYLSTSRDRIDKSASMDCDGTEARSFRVHFPQSFGNSGPLDWDGQTVDAKWMRLWSAVWSPDSVRGLPKGVTVLKRLHITLVDQNNHPGHGNGWGAACPGLLRFDPEWSDPDAGIQVSAVQVTRLQQQSAGDDQDEWEIVAAPGPDGNGDVAACLGGTSEYYVLGYYHVPFQVNVVCKGEDC